MLHSLDDRDASYRQVVVRSNMIESTGLHYSRNHSRHRENHSAHSEASRIPNTKWLQVQYECFVLLQQEQLEQHDALQIS